MGGISSARRAAGLALALVAAVTGAVATGPGAVAATSSLPAVWERSATDIALGATTVAPIAPTFRTAPGVAWQKQATVTVDARGLAKVAKVRFAKDCTVTGLVARCPDTLAAYVSSNDPGFVSSAGYLMWVSPLRGAKLGTSGGYTMTASIPGMRFVPGPAGRVVVGAPELRPAALAPHKGLKVGSVVNERVSFTNIGSLPAAGTQIMLEAAPGLSFAQHHRNCQYWSSGGWSMAICHFPGVVRPGETLATQAELKVDRTALNTGFSVTTLPEGDEPGFVLWAASPKVWGTGTPLGLQVVTPGRATNLRPSHLGIYGDRILDTTAVRMQAVNTADLGVSGWTGSGKQGDVVQVRLGIQNHGPARILDLGHSIPFRFTAPPGTTVVQADPGCALENPAVPGVYLCSLEGFDVPVNSYAYPYWFQLRVDQVIPQATGSVALTQHLPFDPNPSNDSAPVVLN